MGECTYIGSQEQLNMGIICSMIVPVLPSAQNYTSILSGVYSLPNPDLAKLYLSL